MDELKLVDHSGDAGNFAGHADWVGMAVTCYHRHPPPSTATSVPTGVTGLFKLRGSRRSS